MPLSLRKSEGRNDTKKNTGNEKNTETGDQGCKNDNFRISVLGQQCFVIPSQGGTLGTKKSA